MDSSDRKKLLKELISKYIDFKEKGKLDLSSEETIRSWLNDLLSIFGRDTKDTSEVLQEKVLSPDEKLKLKEIGSQNSRPDYTFKLGKQKLTFLDAKDLSVSLNDDKVAAFQIKSYGWSILAPCAFISNFEEFVIYDCTYTPNKDQPAEYGRIYLRIEQFIDNFEILDKHLLKANIYNGDLKKIYISNKSSSAVEAPDVRFAALLSSFRLLLANDILKKNQKVIGANIEALSYIVQVVINRILFVRICEERKIEEEGYLLRIAKKGFRDLFKKSSYFEFYDHYDGPLFERVKLLQDIDISNEVLSQLLEHLYYPSPYKFDVIPIKLLSDIYEIFLSRKLTINNGIVQDEFKSEYIKTKGAVSTPQYIVQEVINQTIKEDDALSGRYSSILDLKILDIACGSGVFLIELYDYLEDLFKKFALTQKFKYGSYFIDDTFTVLNLAGKKAIIENCIFGIDIDPEAVEVAKMSLSLKVIDSIDYLESYDKIGMFGKKILNGIGANIRCGNTLVGNDIKTCFPEIEKDKSILTKINPFDFASPEGFKDIFENKLGFDYIIGNPPYVEVKNYNNDIPHMHKYIKDMYASATDGKTDLAIPFIEKSIGLLNAKGKLGFVIQKRFFKTNYGKNIRDIITKGNYIKSIIDFEKTNIFADKMTYVAILVLDKGSASSFTYKKITAEKDIEREFKDSSRDFILPSNSISENVRSFDNPELLAIKSKYIMGGKFGQLAKVKVGIQVLWDKAYHIKVKSINDGIIIGDTHIEKGVQIELAACRGLICNENYYPYCENNNMTYVIFPYDIKDGKSQEILFDDFCKRFPLAGKYLIRNQGKIKEEVITNDDNQKWHLYTRVQNHGATYNKIVIPMTSIDTFASVCFSGELYCDNANVNFIELGVKTKENIYAISAVVNSTLFSVLARSIANPQANGYFKFNKQFLEPIPFPLENYKKEVDIINKLAEISMEIEGIQKDYLTGSPSQKRIIRSVLNTHWQDIDNLVYKLYNANTEEIKFFSEYGRNKDRIDILD